MIVTIILILIHWIGRTKWLDIDRPKKIDTKSYFDQALDMRTEHDSKKKIYKIGEETLYIPNKYIYIKLNDGPLKII